MKRFLLLLVMLATAVPADAQERTPPPPEAETRDSGGWLGFQYERVTGAGLPITRVVPDSPAERAGLAPGDTVIRVGGAPATIAAVQGLRLAPGDTVRLDVRRAGRQRPVVAVAAPRPARTIVVRTPERTVTLDLDSLERTVRSGLDTLALLSDSTLRRLDREVLRLDSGVIRLDSLARVFRVDEMGRVFRGMRLDSLGGRELSDAVRFGLAAGARALAGAEFSEVNPELGSYFGTERGLLVLRVAPGTPAARAGLRPGDVVTRAGGEEVATLRALRRAVQRAPDGRLVLEVLRERRPRELRLQWDEAGESTR